jgi:hypothetical protein
MVDGVFDPSATLSLVANPLPGAQIWFTPNLSFVAKFDDEFGDRSQTYADRCGIRGEPIDCARKLTPSSGWSRSHSSSAPLRLLEE